MTAVGPAGASEIRDLHCSAGQSGYNVTNNSISASANIALRLDFFGYFSGPQAKACKIFDMTDW